MKKWLLLVVALVLPTVIFTVTEAKTTGNTLRAVVLSSTASGAPLDVTCIKAAVDKRENAIMVANDTYATAVKMILNTRKSALLAAYDQGTLAKIKKAVKAAWGKYATNLKAAKTTLRKAKQSAWNTFKQEAKKCKNKVEENNDIAD